MKNKQFDFIAVFKLVVVAILATVVLIGCEQLPGTEGDNGEGEVEQISFDKGFYRPELDSLSERIDQWIEYSQVIPAVQETVIDGNRYLLITAGSKPTPGYGVQVQEIVSLDDTLEVRVVFTKPNEEDILAQVITFPFDIVILEDRDTPLTFVNVDNPDDYFMTLVGKETIDRPFVASNEWIHLFSPEANEVLDGSINVSGVASVFEGTVNYELLAGAEVTEREIVDADSGDTDSTNDRAVLDTGFMQAAMGSWGYFEKQINIPEGFDGKQLTLVVYSESAKDGSKLFPIEIPLKIK